MKEVYQGKNSYTFNCRWVNALWAFGSNIYCFVVNVTISSIARKFSLSYRLLILITEYILFLITFFWAARKYGGTSIKERNIFIDIHCPKGLLANFDTLESNRFILTLGFSLQPPFRSHTASDVFQNAAFAIKQLFSNLEQQYCNIKRDKSIYFGVTTLKFQLLCYQELDQFMTDMVLRVCPW